MKSTLLFALAIALSACAVDVVRQPVALSEVQGAQAVRTSADVNLTFDTGYSRFVPALSRFVQVGRLPQGDVYRPLSSVFTVEGQHVHEAYWVVDRGQLVGFYLPVERSFSPLGRTVPVSFLQ